MATHVQQINSPFTETGDDVYVKYTDSDFSGTNWTDDNISATEIAATNVYQVTLDTIKAGIAYLNAHLQSFSANATTDVITAIGHGLLDGQTVRFQGANLPSPLVQGTLYYIRDKTTDTFKVEEVPSTTAVNLTNIGSGSMSFTAPSERSIDDTVLGVFPAVAVATLTPEGEESLVSEVIAAFKADPQLGSLLGSDTSPSEEELSLRQKPGRTDVDFYARNASGQWYNTDTIAFETYDSGNLADYRITATETPSGSGLYKGTRPTGATEYELRVRDDTLDDSYVVAGPVKVDNGESTLSPESVSSVVSGLYSSLSGIAPTVQLSYDPVTMQIRLTDGDDWKDGVRTIDIPITLPAGVSVEDCTATFGAVKGTDRIDRLAEVVTVEDIPNVRLTFDRADTLNKPDGRYSWDAEVQYTDEEEVVSSITTLEGVLILRKGIAKLPADIT